MTRQTMVFIFFVFFFLTPREAAGYIDLGTGSFLLQVLAGVFLGGLYVVKIRWKKLVDYFRKLRNPDNQGEQ